MPSAVFFGDVVYLKVSVNVPCFIKNITYYIPLCKNGLLSSLRGVVDFQFSVIVVKLSL